MSQDMAPGAARGICVSACLLGEACRYDGTSQVGAAAGAVARLAGRLSAVARSAGLPAPVAPVCPETAGGLSTPRPPAERSGGRVLTCDGADVTAAYEVGAARSLDMARAANAHLAILKAKSPSCGSGRIYDGTFSGALVPGWGVAAALFKEEGIAVVDEDLVARCEPSVEHPVAIVLGSGLGGLAQQVKVVRRIPYAEIRDFPADAVPVAGHRYEALVGTIDGVPVVVYPGRVHLYQGYSAYQVTSLVRHAARLGCRSIILSCASGAVGGIRPGTVGLITDQLNFTGQSPLACPEGVAAAGLEVPFVAMAGAYSPYLGELARAAAGTAGVELAQGTYAGLLGPTFETAAEVRALGALGADYVGMSTVCEAIMARALGLELLGITLVTNKAGLAENDHAEVLCAADAGAAAMQAVVRGVLGLLGGPA